MTAYRTSPVDGVIEIGTGKFLLCQRSRHSTRECRRYYFETEQERTEFVAANPKMDLYAYGPFPPHVTGPSAQWPPETEKAIAFQGNVERR